MTQGTDNETIGGIQGITEDSIGTIGDVTEVDKEMVKISTVTQGDGREKQKDKVSEPVKKGVVMMDEVIDGGGTMTKERLRKRKASGGLVTKSGKKPRRTGKRKQMM